MSNQATAPTTMAAALAQAASDWAQQTPQERLQALASYRARGVFAAFFNHMATTRAQFYAEFASLRPHQALSTQLFQALSPAQRASFQRYIDSRQQTAANGTSSVVSCIR